MFASCVRNLARRWMWAGMAYWASEGAEAAHVYIIEVKGLS
jgi:hypothetical protein